MEYYRTLPSFDAALPLYTAFYLSSLGVIAGAGIEALVNSKRQRTKKLNPSIKPHEVAAIVAAHNEELSIANTINALKKILPTRNIYIGSDASTDKTVEIAASLDVNVADIWPNRGKARVLVHLLRTYNLFNRYKAIMIIDADAAVSENYLQHALPLLDDPEVAAVAGHGVARWKKHWIPTWAMFFIAYRVRLWRIVQYGMRYGQTWKHFNMSYIIPGSPSMYRASVLRQLEIDAPGLIIEDFNMTFEVHKKKLGKIAYSPNVYAVHQDPYTLKDYIKQLKRWNLGFWQTWRRHKIWPSAFVVTTNFFMIELAIYSILLLAFPFFLIYFFFNSGVTVTIPFLQESFTAFELLIGILLFDYVTTVIAALLERKPQLLFYGLGFIFLRYIDAAIYLWSIPAAFIVRSDGRWASPQRHAIPA